MTPAAVPMMPPIDALIEILTHECLAYRELLAHSEQERASIVGRDPGELNRLVAEKERLVASIGRLETRRQAWTAAWVIATAAPEPASLTTIADTLDPAARATIAHLRDELLTHLHDLAALNERNNLLVQSALRIVSRSIDAFRRVSAPNGYMPSGSHGPSTHTVVLDRRV